MSCYANAICTCDAKAVAVCAWYKAELEKLGWTIVSSGERPGRTETAYSVMATHAELKWRANIMAAPLGQKCRFVIALTGDGVTAQSIGGEPKPMTVPKPETSPGGAGATSPGATGGTPAPGPTPTDTLPAASGVWGELGSPFEAMLTALERFCDQPTVQTARAASSAVTRYMAAATKVKDHAARSVRNNDNVYASFSAFGGSIVDFDVSMIGALIEDAAKIVAFATAMRKADPGIEIIGWGDSGWAPKMLEVAGEHLQYIAFHHHFGSGLPDSPLYGNEWRKDPDRTWEHLMHAHRSLDAKIREMREQVSGKGVHLAMTEGHFALGGRNRCEVLSTWAAGVANARMLNVHARHGDVLKIATLADFCGTRWQVNAIMIPVPGGRSFLMPVARVMALYRHHVGERSLKVEAAPEGLDVTASITGNRVYVHIVNTMRTRAIGVKMRVTGRAVRAARAYTLAASPEFEIIEHQDGVLEPVEKAIPADGTFTSPAASVSALELDLDAVS